MIVLDAGVLIAYLSTDDRHHLAVSTWLADHVIDDFGAPVLTLGESLVHAIAAGEDARARNALHRLAVSPIPALPGDEWEFARVRGEAGLRMPDAVVLATAERGGDQLATTDHRLAKVAADRGVVAHLLG